MLPVPLNSSKITSSIVRAGLDQRGGQDGQRAAVLDVARGAEEPLRRVERGRVDTTGQDAPARRGGEVVGAAEAGDRVEQHDDVVAQLDQALGALDGELGDRGVVLGGPVEGRGDDLALHRALHVGDLFGPLVDEHDHEVALGVVRRDRVGDRLQDHRLAGLGRRDDQTALALADRRDQVDDPRRQDARLGLQAQPLLRVERRQLAELGARRAASSGSGR